MAYESGFFDKFPKISYNGVDCIDLTKRVRIQDSTLRQPNVFYPYQLTAGQRPDTIAFDYYQDPNVEWLPYLSNGIVDPYYGWYLDEEEFNRHVEFKYGSIEEAVSRIAYWSTNWADQSFDISPSYYMTNLPETLKKYWTPNYGQGARILSYKRREEDWYVSTNWIERLELTSVSGEFVKDELVDFRPQIDAVNTGFGEITVIDGDDLDVRHLTGTYPIGGLVVGRSSGAHGVISAVTRLATSITLDELVYWSPTTVFDVERERNEKNKNITLIDVDYIPEFLAELRRKLS